jgi:hypothetical protein
LNEKNAFRILNYNEMNTNSIFILPVIFLALLLSSCTTSLNRSEHDLTEESVTVEYFNKIDFDGGYKITLQQDSIPSLVIKTTEALHSKIDVWVESEILHIVTRAKDINADEIKLKITVHELKNIAVRGGVFMTTKDFINVDQLNLNIQGGAHIDMKLTGNKINVKGEGGVNIQLEGITNEFTAITEGAGNIDADQLKAENVTCRVSGVGNVSVYATKHLNATVEGLGKISYRGDPSITKQIDGIGLVYKK